MITAYSFDSRLTILREVAPSVWRAIQAIRYPLALFGIVRVWLSLWALATVLIFGAPDPSEIAQHGVLVFEPVASGAGFFLLEPWHRWDTNWYLKIASVGYGATDGSIAFFPLYPLLIRTIGAVLGGNNLFAALLVSNLAALGSLILLYRMCVRRFGERVARKALVYLLVFPTAFFLFAGYTEPLFLLLALLTLQSAHTGSWRRAGLFCGLTLLTRLPGIGLFVPLGFEFVRQFRQRRATWRDLGWILLTSAIGTGYWLYLISAFGNLEVWSRGLAFWRANAFPGQSVVTTIQMLTSGSSFAVANNLIDLAATCFFIALIIWGLRRLPPTFSLYSAAVILPPLLSVQTIVPTLPLASLPRYGIVLFPIFVSLARTRSRPRFEFTAVVLSLALQACFVALFVKWIWIA